jgi:hypothetical protein
MSLPLVQMAVNAERAIAHQTNVTVLKIKKNVVRNVGVSQS